MKLRRTSSNMPPRKEIPKLQGKGNKNPKSGSTPVKPAQPEGQRVPGNDDNDVTNSKELTVLQSNVLSKILARFDGLETEIKSVKSTVDEGIRAQEFNSKQAEDKLQKHISDYTETKEEVSSLASETDGLKTRMTFQNFRLTEIEEKIEYLERERRKNMLLIEGVPEDSKVPSPEIVETLFADLKLNFDTHVCDRIYRRGKEPQGKGTYGANRGRK